MSVLTLFLQHKYNLYMQKKSYECMFMWQTYRPIAKIMHSLPWLFARSKCIEYKTFICIFFSDVTAVVTYNKITVKKLFDSMAKKMYGVLLSRRYFIGIGHEEGCEPPIKLFLCKNILLKEKWHVLKGQFGDGNWLNINKSKQTF